MFVVSDLPTYNHIQLFVTAICLNGVVYVIASCHSYVLLYVERAYYNSAQIQRNESMITQTFRHNGD